MLLLALVLASSVRAGVIRTLDGKTVQGTVYIADNNQLLVRTAVNVTESIPLANVLSATFRGLDAEVPAAAAAGHWVGRDIGRAGIAGGARFSGGVAAIRASGADIGGTADAGYFVYQLIDGDGQIVARLTSLQQTHRDAKAGLMVRASVEPSSQYAAVLARAGGGTRFQSRPRLGAASTDADAGNLPPPCWLKLQRSGNELRASVSSDGENWQFMGSQTVNLPPRVLVGLAVCSHNEMGVCAATFERVALTSLEMSETETASAQPGKGVLLRRGSFLAGSIDGFDGSMVRLQDPLHRIPAAEVARIHFKPLRPEQALKLRPGITGVLLASGDFVEGEVTGIEEHKVKLSSVLFGLRRIETSQVGAIVLHDPAPAPSQYEIRLRSGSVLLVDQLKTEKDQLNVDDPAVGALQLHAGQVQEIRAGLARFQPLVALRATHEDGGGGVVMDGTVGGVSMTLGGRTDAHGIGLPAGSSVSYGLGGAYRILVFRAGVPEAILPAAAVRFVVRADEKEIYRSAPRTSLDEPLSATLNIGGAKVLRLSVEAADELPVGASGFFGDPALVK